MELRDSITFVFGSRLQFNQVILDETAEALITFDPKKDEIYTNYSRSKDPPVGRTAAAVLASLCFFVCVSFVNIKYTEYIGGKVSSHDQAKIASN